MHGPTFMANPLACAAANASLDLFKIADGRWQMADEKKPLAAICHLPSADWRSQIESIESQLAEELEPCRALPHVVDVRVKGAIGVVQMEPQIDVRSLRPKFIERGVWLRPFKDIVYIMPPLVIAPEELGKLTQAIVQVLSE